MLSFGVKVRSALVATLVTTLAAALAGATLIAAAPAHAQNFPSSSVKLIVPVPAGGVTDTMARIVAQRLTEMWGQPVVVDNRPGGNYGIGAQAVSRSPPDGYTLLVAPDSTFTANPALIAKINYDPKEFTPIKVLCRASPVLVVNSAVAAGSVKELIALAKSQPGKLNYGSYGIGTYAHLSMEDFKQRTGTDIVHIPYRGAAPAAEKRLATRPDLPTISEAGVPGFATSVWFALWGPPNVPQELVAKIHADVGKALDLPASRDYFKTNSLERVDLSPAQFSDLIQSDLRHWSALINAVGARIE